MKDREHRLSALKHQLAERKGNRQEYVIWALTEQQLEYVKNLGYPVIPWIYRIRTKQMSPFFRSNDSILRVLHFANKKKKNTVFTRLKKGEKEVLDRAGIEYKPYKYKIILSEKSY